MITNLITPIANTDNLKDIRRSRFSLHFNTARRRRWLLVQLVSAPTPDEAEPGDIPAGNRTRHRHESPRASAALLDPYTSAHLGRHCF